MKFDILTEKLDPELVKDVIKLFDHDMEAQFAQAAEEAKEIGRRNRSEERSSDGIGPKRAGLHPLHVAAWRQLGVNVRDDPEAMEWVLKHPEMEYAKVPERAIKIVSVGFGPGTRKRFSKSYG